MSIVEHSMFYHQMIILYRVGGLEAQKALKLFILHLCTYITRDRRLYSQICALLPSRRAQYQPLTLNRLQYLIDLGRVDPTQPIDLTQLVNGRGVTIQPQKRDYGVQLVGEVRWLSWLRSRVNCHS